MRLNLDWKLRKPFYGWWIVGACFFIALYMGGVVAYGFTAFFEPLANEFNWSHAQISLAASLRGMEMGLLAPLVGLLVDRWGPRRPLFMGVITVSLGLMFLSRTTSLSTFYGAFALVAVGMSACSWTVLMAAVANWFRGKVGIATGIMMCGYGLSGLLVPIIVNLIDTYEWRGAMVILAISVSGLCLPLSLLIRHRPEQYGYRPDGEVENTATSDDNLTQARIAEANVGTRQAIKSRTFWHITVALLCQMLMLNAVVTHVMPYLGSIGISRAKSSLIASAIPLASIGGRLSFGWLADRHDTRRVMAGGFAMICGGLFCFAFASSEASWVLTPFFILFGIGYGGNNTLTASVTREFFGRSNFGSIHGLMSGIIMLGIVAGAPLAGWVFDKWGSYQPIWFVFVGLAVAALLIVATTPPTTTTVQLVDMTSPCSSHRHSKH